MGGGNINQETLPTPALPQSHFGKFHHSPLRQLWTLRDLPGLKTVHRLASGDIHCLNCTLAYIHFMKSVCGNQLCSPLHTDSLHSRKAGQLKAFGLLYRSYTLRYFFRPAVRGHTRTLRAFTARRITSRNSHVYAAASAFSKDTAHLQLATAKLSRCGFIGWRDVDQAHNCNCDVEA